MESALPPFSAITNGAGIVFLKILSLLPVLLLGWLAARRGWIGRESVAVASRMTVDLALPALTFTQLLRTVTPASLRAQWPLPLAGAGLMILGWLAGVVAAPLFVGQERWPTFVFLITLSNSIYLPLPIAEALHGEEGVRAVLLLNLGVTVLQWTLAVGTLLGRPDGRTLRNLALSPGLIATLAAIAASLGFPALRTLERLDPRGATPGALAGSALLQALSLLGSMTIPLALLVAGARLDMKDLRRAGRSRAPLAGVLLSRLVLAPAAAGGAMLLAAAGGIYLDEVSRSVIFLISCMPVAINCGVFTERYGGDSSLAAGSIFSSTLLSVLTVPALFYLAKMRGL
jgi:predicted permease